ncbi:universal stress protein [Cellulomonas sp. SG140]|uniref:universal stress protein n=1 Tax=Cellulomonas sp. SG140 TaxID=2976536 RepID=UPI0021E945CF|nr:universal stress protein [Cellulomonas sp. SG140]HEX3005425.1 universal stress protein [Angustibacter sp.]
MKRILVGYDGSEAADAALDLAADLARRYGAELHVLGVTHVPEIADDVETEALLDRAESHTSAVLEGIGQRFTDLAPVVVTQVGHPAEQILRYAETNGVDHIVLGHRGRSRLERWMLGSVSRRVATYARCTVTITRPDASRPRAVQ